MSDTCTRCGFTGQAGSEWLAAVDIGQTRFYLLCPRCRIEVGQ